MTTLVTGGAGFIGANLVSALLTQGHDVVVLDDFSTGRLANVQELDCKVVEGSISNPVDIARAMYGCDAVVHLAARGSVPRSLRDPVATHEVNASGTLNVMEAARRESAYVVFSSSSSVYGQNPELPKSERSWTRPMSPYGASKLAAEGYVMAYRTSFGMDAQVFRFFNVFGPGQRPDHDYAAVIPKWIYRMQRGEPIEIHGDGMQSRDFTHVDTVTSVLVDAVARRVSIDGPVNLALGQRRSLLDVLGSIESILGVKATVEHTPARPGDVRDSQNDPALLLETFPSLAVQDFELSLTGTAEWLAREFSSVSPE